MAIIITGDNKEIARVLRQLADKVEADTEKCELTSEHHPREITLGSGDRFRQFVEGDRKYTLIIPVKPKIT